jgi:histidinol-phosphatase (PHP family)
MLTDYHVHLRPDDAGTTAARYFTTTNADRYRDAASERGIEELGVSEHIYRFTQALEVWDHELWRENALDDLDEYCGFVSEETSLKLGIEADFIPGREDRMANLLDGRPWDYVIGSVHFLGNEAVDYDKYDVWTRADSADKVWRRYFEVLGEAAGSGMFDILAHPDLVKMWGEQRPHPDRDLRYYYEIAMDGILDSGIAVELSTAGLRKPVGEIYPSVAFLEMLVDAGVPIALSSDAHIPEHIGHGYDHALEVLERVGVTELCVFEGRARRLVEIGASVT